MRAGRGALRAGAIWAIVVLTCAQSQAQGPPAPGPAQVPAQAQAPSQARILAAVPQTAMQLPRICEADRIRFCPGEYPIGVSAAACLRQSYVSVSRGCRGALDASRSARDAVAAGERANPPPP